MMAHLQITQYNIFYIEELVKIKKEKEIKIPFWGNEVR